MAEVDALQEIARKVEETLAELSGQATAILRRRHRDRDAVELQRTMVEIERWRALLRQVRDRFKALPPMDAAPGATPPDPMANARRISAQSYFSEVNARLTLLDRAMAALARLDGGWKAPLYPPDAGADGLCREQLAAFDGAVRVLHKVANPAGQSEGAEAHGCYADIPLAPAEFVAHAHAASRIAMAQGRPRPVRFLDVGCGGGVKLVMARRFFEVADGLEYDPGYAEAAGRMLETAGDDACRVMQGDALTFEDYAGYDVIYFYKPMREYELMRRLELRILERARPGTILIAPYSEFAAVADSHRCAWIDGAIHVQGLDREAVADLKDAAERVGVFTRHEHRRLDRWARYLAPLVEAVWLTGGFR